MTDDQGKPIVEVGPSAAPVVNRPDSQLGASFRIVTCYDLPTDGFTTRLDVLLGGVENERRQIIEGTQLNCLIRSTSPQTEDNRRFGELILPNGPSIAGRYAVMANPGDLAAMFRGLAEAIEKTLGIARV